MTLRVGEFKSSCGIFMGRRDKEVTFVGREHEGSAATAILGSDVGTVSDQKTHQRESVE